MIAADQRTVVGRLDPSALQIDLRRPSRTSGFHRTARVSTTPARGSSTRMTGRAAAAVAVLASVLSLGACACGEATATDKAKPTAAAAEVATPVTPDTATPELALSLSADDSATGRRIAAAQAAVREHPDVIEAYTALASALLKRRRETSNAVFLTYAQDVLTAAERRAPGDAAVGLLTAMVLLEQHRFLDAADKARRLAVALPNDPTPHLVLGDALLELGEYEASADAVQAAMNLRPDLRSYNRAAHMRWLYGDFDGALTIMDLAIDAGSARDPEGQAWCFADLGAMYLAQGDARRAAASADRALTLLPGYVPGLVVQSKAQAAQGDAAAAIATLSDAVERRPAAEDLLTLSEWLDDAQRPEEAAQRRQQGQRLAEDDPRPVAHFLARHDERPDEALRLAELELAARKNIAAHDTHALALLRNGRLVEASAAMDKAMALGTLDANLLLHAGLIQAAAGDPGRAKTSLSRALSLDASVDPRLVAELRKDLGDA
ncbi:MAG: hypothetical protein AAF721_37240 [Myxococcota bacterium]